MQGKWWKYGVIVWVAAGLAACSKVPGNILQEKEMQQVLTDMLIAEAITNTDYQTYREDSTKLALYQSVFRKYGITQALYDSSLVWYGRNLNIYIKMYERVVVDLDRRIADLGDVQADAAPSSNRDSVDIWPRGNLMVLEPSALFNGVVFDIKPESNYPSGSSFVLGVRFWGLKKDPAFKPELRLSAEQRDTTLTVTREIGSDGYYEAVLRTLPTRQVRRVYGSIRLDNMDSTYYKVYVDSLSLMRYNYGTPFHEE